LPATPGRAALKSSRPIAQGGHAVAPANKQQRQKKLVDLACCKSPNLTHADVGPKRNPQHCAWCEMPRGVSHLSAKPKPPSCFAWPLIPDVLLDTNGGPGQAALCHQSKQLMAFACSPALLCLALSCNLTSTCGVF
jgi:hypothetical protein